MSTELFPLPLSPFEYYYWCDDRPEYPTTFPIELMFSPALLRGQFERALELVIVRHPLLSSLVAEDGRKGPNWIGGGQLAPVEWAAQETPIGHADGERIDLRRMPGLRIWARESSDSTRLLFQFHHACCDGFGALRFLEDLMIAYARECGMAASIRLFTPPDPSRLRFRAELDLPNPTIWTVLRDWWVGAKIWMKFARQTPAALAVSQNSTGVPKADKKIPMLGFASQSLDPELISRLRPVIRKTGCTINDILLCGLFLALRTWNAAHKQSDGLIRINMPVLIGNRGDMRMPAANTLTFTFLNRKARECDNPVNLLESIRRETEAIKRYQLGLYFVGGLNAFRNVPGLIPRFLHERKCRATAVLSNVGRLFPHIPLPRSAGKIVCGNTILQSVRGVPPIRPLTRASIIAITYAGCTGIHLRCDPHYFDRESQDEFLTQYISHLEQMAHGTS